MRSVKSKSVQIVIFRLLTCSGLLVTTISAARAAEKLNNARELLVPVMESLKGVEQPQTGRGSAVLKVDDFSGSNEYFVEFVFKGDQSRSDRFLPISDGKLGKRLIAWSMGRELYVVCNEFSASINTQPSWQWYREFGYDFHPDAFATINHVPVAEYIQRMIDASDTMSAGLDSNGMLKIVSERRVNNHDIHEVLVLDETKGFRPVSHEMTSAGAIKGARGVNRVYCRISWKQYGSAWYVTNGESERSVSFTDKEPKDMKPANSRIEFVVEDFDADIDDIEDLEFTVDGLNVPDGLPVVDDVAGFTYRYGAPPLTMEDLKKPLTEAEFPALIEGRIEENSDETFLDSATAGQIDGVKTEAGEPALLGGRASRHKNIHLVTAVGAVSAFALVLALALKYLRFWKGGVA